MSNYFKERYGKLYEEVDEGELEVFKIENEHGKIQNMFLKREIPIKINNKTYYDLATPYGYGGPVILETKNDQAKKKLIQKYHEEFSAYCQENNIVTEFIRFHPVLENHKDFESIYEIDYQRKTIGTNLADYDDPFQKEFSKSTRKRVRRLLREGVTYEIEKAPETLDPFIKIYKETMDRNQADDYYYFNQEYFDDILKNLRDNVLLVHAIYKEKIIASELTFLSTNGLMHAHLGGVKNAYLHLSPNYLTMYALTVWGKKHGYKIIHTGGGLTDKEDDSLLEFKQRFGVNTQFDYYFGKKIWNPEIYQKLNTLTNADPTAAYFPAYRAND